MRKFLNYVVIGAGGCLGYFVMNKVINDLSNPVKKAKLKKGIKNLKQKIES